MENNFQSRSRLETGVRRIPIFAFATALLIGFSGCHSPSQYVSPRVVGRVVDEETEKPIAGVQVSRRPKRRSSVEPPKGAELLKEIPPVTTSADGQFSLDSVRDIAFFRRLRWTSVSLSFRHRGYESLVTNYSATIATTNTPKGEPLVEAGDVRLRPRPKE